MGNSGSPTRNNAEARAGPAELTAGGETVRLGRHYNGCRRDVVPIA